MVIRSRHALDTAVQHLVGHDEGVGERGSGAGVFQQLVVVQCDQGVHAAFKLGKAVAGDLDAARTFKGEGDRNDGDGNGPDLPGVLGQNWGGAGAGSAAHAGGDKHHVGAVHQVGQFLATFGGCPLTEAWIAARAKMVGGAAADDQAAVSIGDREVLNVGVNGDKFHAIEFGGDHPVDGVVSGAPNPDDADVGESRRWTYRPGVRVLAQDARHEAVRSLEVVQAVWVKPAAVSRRHGNAPPRPTSRRHEPRDGLRGWP